MGASNWTARVLQRGQAATPAVLDLTTLYRAPSGRLCKLLPRPASLRGPIGAYYTFRYVDTPAPGSRRRPEDFHLARQAIHLLQVVG